MFQPPPMSVEQIQSSDVAESSMAYPVLQELPSTLGELVVTDPRDPIVWKSAQNLELSSRAFAACWAIYRERGLAERNGVPLSESEIKFHDKYLDDELVLKAIWSKNYTDVDADVVMRYIAHLHLIEDATAEFEAVLNAPPRIGGEAVRAARHRFDE